MQLTLEQIRSIREQVGGNVPAAYGSSLKKLFQTVLNFEAREEMLALCDLAERAISGEWRTIETAPKDGTLIEVALTRNGILWRVSDARFNGIAWYTKTGESLFNATHWRPLPKPPEVKQ